MFPPENFTKMKAAVKSGDNCYLTLAENILRDVDRGLIKSLLLSMGVHAGYYGTKTVRANRDKYNCNIPWTILFDPTSACNLHCKGCWAAEYGHALKLSLDEMRSIVKRGRALGTHFYMLTGGEPLIRKDDIVTLAKENPECTFLIYTNATLVDEKLCRDIKKCGNITLALSIEGTKESNDDRRGEGAYSRTLKAMELLKREKILFGISICYTRKNVEAVTDDAFLDKMVDLGVKYAFYFNYMPVGHDADIIVAAAGKAKMVGPDITGDGKIIIDVGINIDDEGKLCGDVDFDAVSEKAEAITPVPGGVGSVTTAVLMKHVIEAAAKAYKA